MQLHHLNSPLYILFDSCDNKVLRLSQVCPLGSIAQAQSLLLAHRFSSPCNKYSSRNFCSQADTACSTGRRACRGDAKDSESEEWYRLHVRKTVLRSSSRQDLSRTFLRMPNWYGTSARQRRSFFLNLLPLIFWLIYQGQRARNRRERVSTISSSSNMLDHIQIFSSLSAPTKIEELTARSDEKHSAAPPLAVSSFIFVGAERGGNSIRNDPDKSEFTMLDHV